jgi:SnoaL-like domain
MTEIADRYLAVWRESDPVARRAAIADLWAPDGVEYVEGVQFRGRDELEKRVAEAHQQFVTDLGYSIESDGEAIRNGDIISGTVTLVNQGQKVVWSARVFLVLNSDGLIQEDYQLTVQPLAQ